MAVKQFRSMEHLENILKWELDPRVERLLSNTGFVELHKVSSCRNNSYLLSKLVDAYDKSTCCFNFNRYRIFFSLLDVLYITGLSISGKPVTGKEYNNSELCEKFLGENLCNRDKDDGKRVIKLSAIREKFMKVSEHPSEEELQRAARAYALYMIGSLILPDASGDSISPIYLQLMEKVENIGKNAWGAALWAHLHEHLRKLKDDARGGSAIKGCTMALQIFAILSLPKVLNEIIGTTKTGDREAEEPTFPLMVFWTKKLGKALKNSRKRWNFEDAFQNEDNVVYHPYSDLGDDFLPPHLKPQVHLTRVSVVVVCFNKYAPYYPHKFEEYFGTCVDAWETNIEKSKARTGPKRVTDKYMERDWTAIEAYAIYLARWKETYEVEQPTSSRVSSPEVSDDQFYSPCASLSSFDNDISIVREE